MSVKVISFLVRFHDYYGPNSSVVQCILFSCHEAGKLWGKNIKKKPATTLSTMPTKSAISAAKQSVAMAAAIEATIKSLENEEENRGSFQEEANPIKVISITSDLLAACVVNK